MDILTQILQMTVFFGSLYGFFAVAYLPLRKVWLTGWMRELSKSHSDKPLSITGRGFAGLSTWNNDALLSSC